MKALCPMLALLVSSVCHAQLDVPVRIVLDGATDAERQITGLADPSSGDAAISAGAARSAFATATGTSALIATMDPGPEAYSAGMFITLIPQTTNSANATLDLNGLGERPIVKWGQLPLDSADLLAGSPARLVYDGTRFLLLNNATKPCKTGFEAASATTCVEPGTRPALNFYEAVDRCESIGARLCSAGEWVNACLRRPLFLATVTALEWVDDAANSSNNGKVMGTGSSGPTGVTDFSCKYGTTNLPDVLNNFRCCHSR